MLCVRSCNPLAAPGPVIEVDPATRCTKALPGNELSHLTVTRRGLVAYEDDDNIWPGALLTLAECNLGDKVFAELGVDANLPRIWPLFEVCEADESDGLTEFELSCEVAKLSHKLPGDTLKAIWHSSERLSEQCRTATEQLAIDHARYFLRLLRGAGEENMLPWPPRLRERVFEVFGKS
ncbi:uncharacterized protein SOCEGT47_075780 [Sorangium cellulosum]|uniref:Uncharacterized protein n=1 Tax=Sorangium cellulosum TaxID=56 RepID=A0A4P2QBH1_SORCE|nr:hypothetical protein [Sorangium cellulosum]AUX27005.1 uncharacterized protein SOCEGT47_075780 [Sorangium cellulosum]